MKEKEFCPFCGHPITKKYIEGRDRLFCEPCEIPIYENPVPATAAVIFNLKGEVLLVKRNTEPKIGEWCLPGGYCELYESPAQCCLREVKEETGLDAEILSMEGNILGDSLLYKSIIVMGYSLTNVRGQLTPGDDCDDARFFHPDKMPRIAFRSHREIFANAANAERFNQISSPEITEAVSDSQASPWRKDFGAYVITSGDHLKIAESACRGGAKILQYREKEADRNIMLQRARAIRDITRRYNTLFIMNDYIDIALLSGADGVHLGQDDIPIAEARKMTPPGFIIGVSTHSLEQAVEAEFQGADYIGSGPVYATPTKKDYIPIGVETLTAVLETVRIPVTAIGGLNPDNLLQLKALGARTVAMVRAYQHDTENVVREINRVLLD